MNEAPKPQQLMELIRSTPTAKIAELDIVREKFVLNYNHTHQNKLGELMYHRQLVNLKQLLAASDQLRAVDPFSLYAVIVTVAAKGYSLDPADNEVYVIPKNGKAVIWRQAGAHIRRLIETGQIKYADQAKIVYEGDEFLVERGRVMKHVEKYASETYVAAYIRFQLLDDSDRYFIYRKSDWQAWHKKAPSANKATWEGGPLGQPDPGFLRTKITKHACIEKVWSSGGTPPMVEVYHDVEYDEIAEEPETPKVAAPVNGHAAKIPEAKNIPANDDAAFEVLEEAEHEGVVHADESDEF